MVEGGVDHRIGRRSTARHAVRMFERAAMHAGPSLLEPARAGIRPREPNHLMPGADQLGHDLGADETGGASEKYTHDHLRYRRGRHINPFSVMVK